MPVPSLKTHTDAVISALEGFGLVVADVRSPRGNPPFVRVEQVPGGDTYGPLADQNGDAELLYQVTCVGGSRVQAQELADTAMGLLSGLTITGRSVPHVVLDTVPGIQHDKDAQPPVYWATPRFRIFTTPS